MFIMYKMHNECMMNQAKKTEHQNPPEGEGHGADGVREERTTASAFLVFLALHSKHF